MVGKAVAYASRNGEHLKLTQNLIISAPMISIDHVALDTVTGRRCCVDVLKGSFAYHDSAIGFRVYHDVDALDQRAWSTSHAFAMDLHR